MLDLVLDRTLSLKKEQTVFIFSPFDLEDCGGKVFEDEYAEIEKKFVDAGYQMPHVVFWKHEMKPIIKMPVHHRIKENLTQIWSGYPSRDLIVKTLLEKGLFRSVEQLMMMMASIENIVE